MFCYYYYLGTHTTADGRKKGSCLEGDGRSFLSSCVYLEGTVSGLMGYPVSVDDEMTYELHVFRLCI